MIGRARATAPRARSSRSSSSAAVAARSAGSTSIDLAQRPDRAAAAVQLLLVELGAPAQQASFCRRIDGAPGLLVDQLAQLLPGAPALERPLEQLRDLAIVGARVEQAPVVLLRLRPLRRGAVIEDLGGRGARCRGPAGSSPSSPSR